MLHLRDAVTSDGPAIRAIVFGVLREYGLCSDPTGHDADIDDVVRNYSERGGVFRVLVSETGEVVGCGGLYPLDGGEVELRKMYFLPSARGHGHGRALLAELLETARARGFQRVVLETAGVLKEAIALYERFGFHPVERPHHASRCDQAFALELKG